MVNGYGGNILYIDLSNNEIKIEPLDTDLINRFIGGIGINNRLASNLIKSGIDPFHEDNPIIIGAGALTGTIAPGTPKLAATTKLPINNAIGTCFSGGGFGFAMKLSGYDHIVITGKRKKPGYISITDDKVDVIDADELWGKDIHETTDKLFKRYGNGSSVISIGPAGEKLIRYSLAMVDKMGTLGRGGLGAVMGAKKIKAIVAKGTKGLKVFDEGRFIKISETIRNKMRSLPFRDEWLKYGIMIGLKMWEKIGFSMDNFRRRKKGIFGKEDYDKVFKATISCPSCPLGDKSLVELDCKKTPLSYGMHIILGWGVKGGANNIEEALKAYDMCNRMGIDDLMLLSIIDYAINLFEEGIIDINNTDGIKLKRDYNLYMKLMDKILKRDGFGHILGEGYYGIIEEFGKDAEKYAYHIKGLDPMIDPRGHFSGLAISQSINPRGAYAIGGNSPAFLENRKPEDFRRYLKNVGVPANAIDRILKEGINIGRLTRYAEDWYSLISSMGICARQPVLQCYNIDNLKEIYYSLTGIDIKDMSKVGERIWNLYRYINTKEGFSRKDDRFPDIFFKPLDKELKLMDYYKSRELDREDIDKIFDEYYDERGWDLTSGIPSNEKLKELGL
jgi:aldehyde:ferredoxin oxidoreductase